MHPSPCTPPSALLPAALLAAWSQPPCPPWRPRPHVPSVLLLPAVEGLMYLAPACTFWLFLGSMLLEFRTMAAEGAFSLMVRRGGEKGCGCEWCMAAMAHTPLPASRPCQWAARVWAARAPLLRKGWMRLHGRRTSDDRRSRPVPTPAPQPLRAQAEWPGKFMLAAAMGFMVNSLAYIVIQARAGAAAALMCA